jgi:hypothetical protein
VDQFVFTARERAWAVALIMFLTMKLLGRRRTICLNYFLAEDRLALAERDAFTASQIASLKPVAGRAFLYRLVRANEWGASFFPNFWERYRSLVAPTRDEPEAGSLFWEAILSLGGGFLLERVGRIVLGAHLQRQLRASPSGSSVKLEPGVLKLHFKDHGPELSRQMHATVPPLLGEEELDSEALAGARSHVSTV